MLTAFMLVIAIQSAPIVISDTETAGRTALLSDLCRANGLVDFEQTDLDALVNDVKARGQASGIDTSTIAEAFSRGLAEELRSFTSQLTEGPAAEAQGNDAGSSYLKAKCSNLTVTYPDIFSVGATVANPAD